MTHEKKIELGSISSVTCPYHWSFLHHEQWLQDATSSYTISIDFIFIVFIMLWRSGIQVLTHWKDSTNVKLFKGSMQIVKVGIP